MSSKSISAFNHDASTISSLCSQNPAGGGAANIRHVFPVCTPMSCQFRESFPPWTQTSLHLNNGTAREEIRHVGSVCSGGLLGGVDRMKLPNNFVCFQGGANAINAVIPRNLTMSLSNVRHNDIAVALGVPQNEWLLAPEHYLLPNNIQQVTFHIPAQNGLDGIWEVLLNIRGGGAGQPQSVIACRIVNDDNTVVTCTLRLPLQIMSIDEFNRPGPQSPAAELGEFHWPEEPESLQPVSKKYLKQSMESLLQDILANVYTRQMPVVSNTAAQAIRRAANDLLGKVQATHLDDPARLRALRAEMVQFLDQTVLPNLTTRGNSKRLTHDGVAWMGSAYFSQLFDTVTADGARNRINRAGRLEPPEDLVAIAIRKLCHVLDAIGKIMSSSGGTANYGVAMFRIGEIEQSGNEVRTLSGTLIANSSISDDIQRNMNRTLTRMNAGKIPGGEEFIQEYADAINVLKSAQFIWQNYQAENRSATPTFPIIRRAGNNADITGTADVEYQILANILRQIDEAGLSRDNIIGHVYLLSRYPICGSCALAIANFERKLPGLDVIVVQQTRNQALDESGPNGLNEVQRNFGSVGYNLNEWIEMLDTGMPSNSEAAVVTAYDTESINDEEPCIFQIPTQQVLQQPPPQQGGGGSRAGNNISIRFDQINGQNITTIYADGQMLFVAEDMFALLNSNAQISNRNDFVRRLLPAILADYFAHVGSTSRTVLVNHDGTTYDVIYSVVGNQIMTLKVEEHFEIDESTERMFNMSVYYGQ